MIAPLVSKAMGKGTAKAELGPLGDPRRVPVP